MEITAIRSFTLNPGVGKNWILVDVLTDAGIRGVGEAFGTGKDAATAAVVNEIAGYLVGEDPTGILRHRDSVTLRSRYPMGTAEMAALSAVEMALWDIAGQRLGAPVHELLGGPVRDRIPVYAGALIVYSFAHLGSGARAAVKAGFRDIKIVPGEMLAEAPAGEELSRQLNEQIREVRAAVGPDIGIAIDYHGRSASPVDARAVLDGLEEPVIFFEEPVVWDSLDPLVEIKASTSTPIAAGEKIISQIQWFEMIRRRAVDYLQPDPAVCGGIAETVRMAGAAATQHILMAPHHASSPVSLMACLQIDTVVPNLFKQEFGVRLELLGLDRLFDHIPQVEDGHVTVSDRPGLGIAFDPDVATEMAAEPYHRPLIRNYDGSIGLE